MRWLLAVLAALGTLTSVAASAIADSVKPDWTVTVGVEGRVLPGYEGSDSMVLRPNPIFDARRAGTPEHFRGPRDSPSVGLFDFGRFVAGPTARLRFPRYESSNSNLRGLGDVDLALEAGVFAEYWPTDWLRGRVEIRQGIGGHHGQIADFTSDVIVPVTPQLTISGGPRLTLESTDATSPYFSITAAQSIASGLPVYDARGGLHSYGAGTQVRYKWSPIWATHVFVEYERLAGDAGNSPLVVQRGSRDQLQLGLGATYSFDMHPLW